MSDQATLICATCEVPVTSHVAAPASDDTVFCPECGVSDTLAAASQEAGDYVRDQESEAIMADLRRIVNGREDDAERDGAEGEVKTKPAKTYRFKTDTQVKGAGCGCGSGGCS